MSDRPIKRNRIVPGDARRVLSDRDSGDSTMSSTRRAYADEVEPGYGKPGDFLPTLHLWEVGNCSICAI